MILPLIATTTEFQWLYTERVSTKHKLSKRRQKARTAQTHTTLHLHYKSGGAGAFTLQERGSRWAVFFGAQAHFFVFHCPAFV
jgi:hypothetical protein